MLGDADKQDADLWLVNTCTVKSPSQSAMSSLLQRGKDLDKKLLVTGCVPQGDKGAVELQGLSLLGTVSQTLLHRLQVWDSKRALPHKGRGNLQQNFPLTDLYHDASCHSLAVHLHVEELFDS